MTATQTKNLVTKMKAMSMGNLNICKMISALSRTRMRWRGS